MIDTLRSSVLITRPEEDAYRIADEIEKRRFHVICEPFLKVVYDTPDHFDLYSQDITQYSGIIFTSANAVRGFKRLNFEQPNIPVFTVGHQTAEIAKESGFKNITSAAGNVEDLVSLLKKEPQETSYLYVHGRDISRTLEFSVPNHTIDHLVVYHTKKIKDISSLTSQIMMRGEVNAVLFYSKRTAEAFKEWVEAQPYVDNIKAGLKRTRALCLGPSMVECLSNMPWKDVQVAQTPTTSSLLALLMDQE